MMTDEEIERRLEELYAEADRLGRPVVAAEPVPPPRGGAGKGKEVDN